MDNVLELINWCYRAYSAYGQYRERVTAITFTSTTMFNLTYMAGYMRSHFPDALSAAQRRGRARRIPAHLLRFELRAADGSLTPVDV